MTTNIARSPLTFPPEHLAVALAWPKGVRGVGPWSVYVDAADCGSEYVTVDPPGCAGDGFHITGHDDGGVAVIWDGLKRHTRAANLLEALQMICPLPPKSRAKVQAIAAATLARPFGFLG